MPSCAQRLVTVAQQHLGESAGVRLTYRYEVLIR